MGFSPAFRSRHELKLSVVPRNQADNCISRNIDSHLGIAASGTGAPVSRHDR